MPVLALINRNVCPPDGFRYVFPIDGFTAHAWTYTDWVNVAIAHLRANNLPVPLNLAEEMETQLCLTLDPGWCLYDDENRPRPTTSLSWDDFTGGIKTFTRWILQGAQYVAQTEADRRGAICARCYLNVNISGCASCQKAVQEIVRDKHSKHDNMLRACAVCKCFLRAKVHFPLSTLDTGDERVQSMYPEFCWLKRHGPNRIDLPG